MRIGLDIDNVITDFDKKLYEEFLTGPGSEKAHELLHSTYVIR